MALSTVCDASAVTTAAELMRSVPPLTPDATMGQAAQRLAGAGIDALPVVADEAGRRPLGVLSTAGAGACRTAGHDPDRCTVERHLDRDFALAFLGDGVERLAPGAAGPAARAVLVVSDDRRLQGIVTAGGAGLRVTPSPKAEPMVGGWGGMELVWRCGDCGYLVSRPASPPDACPDCGAPREHFVLLTED